MADEIGYDSSCIARAIREGGNGGYDDSDADNNDEDDDDSVIDDQTKETEFINKEAPEGIEVAAFDGLNCNEEMG